MIATPISHLLLEKEAQTALVPYTDCFECRDHVFDSMLPKQFLFHCELQPIHHLSAADFDYLKKIRDVKSELKLISFHLASAYKYPDLKDGKFIPSGTKYSSNQMIQNSFENFQKIKNIFGNEIIIAVENNNYYPTEAYDYVTEGTFISEIVDENDIFFLLDIAHAKISSHYKKIPLEKYYSSLPFNKLIQLHISRNDTDKDMNYFDAHTLPTDEELKEVKELKDQFAIKFFTIEYYSNINDLIQLLIKLRDIL